MKETPNSRPREALFVLALTGLAVLVRTYLSTLPHVIKGDESAYIWLGQSIATGNGFTLMGRPEVHLNPLFPAIIAAIYSLTGILEESSTIAFVIFGSLLVVPVYLLSRRIFGKPEAAIAGLLVAIHPALTAYLFYEAGLSEPVYLLMLFSGLYSLYKGMQGGRPRAYFVAGALFGLSYLARSEGIQLLPLALLLVAAGAVLRRELFTVSTGVRAAAIFLGFFVLALPYVSYLHQETGQWMVSGKPWVAYVQNRAIAEGDLETLDRLTWGLDKSGQEVMYFSSDKFEGSLLSEIVDDPRGPGSHLMSNVRRLGSLANDPKLLPDFIWPLAALGLFATPWSRRRLLGVGHLCLALLAGLLPVVLMYPNVRFMAPVFPVILIWSGVGVVSLTKWLVATSWRLGLPHSLIRRLDTPARYLFGTVVAAYFLAAYPSVVRHHQKDLVVDFAAKKVGTAIRSGLRSDSVLMSRDGNLAFYAGQQWVPFPNAPYEEVIAYARSHGVSYLVVDEWSIRATRPQLLFLLDATGAPPDMKVLDRERTDAGTFVIYELLESQRGSTLPLENEVPAKPERVPIGHV